MATASARTPDYPAKPDSDSRNITRREFLNYVLGASVGLLALETAGAAVWFALPHLAPGIDLFSIELADIPASGAAPFHPFLNSGGYWLSHIEGGILALDVLCPHRADAHYKWVSVDNRFECPNCGSQFNLDGTFIIGHGPAPRNIDRFPITVTTPNGTRTTPPDGSPVSIEGALKITVNTRDRIIGKPLIPTWRFWSTGAWREQGT